MRLSPRSLGLLRVADFAGDKQRFYRKVRARGNRREKCENVKLRSTDAVYVLGRQSKVFFRRPSLRVSTCVIPSLIFALEFEAGLNLNPCKNRGGTVNLNGEKHAEQDSLGSTRSG